MSLQDQLSLLRRRIAAIERKWDAPVARVEPERLPGEIVETEAGRHWECEILYPAHARHGSIPIDSMAALPDDLPGALSAGKIRAAPPERWAFLDTETTGLAGGTGTCAFLVGVGRVCAEGFRVRQFFMRDFREESSLLQALAAHLAAFPVLITYN
ncbi:MAG: ribonuclease H-like domain-containing protein, partial [Bryobacteraceae bacterium]